MSKPTERCSFKSLSIVLGKLRRRSNSLENLGDKRRVGRIENKSNGRFLEPPSVSQPMMRASFDVNQGTSSISRSKWHGSPNRHLRLDKKVEKSGDKTGLKSRKQQINRNCNSNTSLISCSETDLNFKKVSFNLNCNNVHHYHHPDHKLLHKLKLCGKKNQRSSSGGDGNSGGDSKRNKKIGFKMKNQAGDEDEDLLNQIQQEDQENEDGDDEDGSDGGDGETERDKFKIEIGSVSGLF